MTLVQLQPDLFIPEDFAENHKYFADETGETEYTGITTILRMMAKPTLIQWAANEACKYVKALRSFDNAQAEIRGVPFEKLYLATEAELEEARTAHTRKKEAAGEHGTNVHALVEEYIKLCLEENGQPFGLFHGEDSEKFTSIVPFVKWAVENVDHFLFVERPVHSKSLWLAGTIDFGAVMKDGSRRVGDLKTGSGIYYEAILQTEFYQLLAEEEGDEKYDGSVIVNMKKDGGFQTQLRSRHQLDRDAALGLLAAYRGNASFIRPNANHNGKAHN